MRNKWAILGFAALVILATTAVFAATGKDAPEKITLDDCMSKKSAVEFPHGVHAKAYECKTCHHTQEGLTAESTEEVKTCASCHVNPEKAETPACGEMSAKKNPFHIVCIDCHKTEAANHPDKALPTKCDQCHPKA